MEPFSNSVIEVTCISAIRPFLILPEVGVHTSAVSSVEIVVIGVMRMALTGGKIKAENERKIGPFKLRECEADAQIANKPPDRAFVVPS